MTSTLSKNSVDYDHSGGTYKGMSQRQQAEYERLRLQHELHKRAMSGELVRVPLSKTQPIRILDSATGDGFWMLDVSKQYPLASFVGTDLFPNHFKQLKNLPASISFKAQNVLSDWPDEDSNAYDLVHQRHCIGQFSPEKAAAVIKRLFSLVKPGGYLQIVEASNTHFDAGDKHVYMERAMEFLVRYFAEFGATASPGPSAVGWMREAGVVDIREEVLSIPIGVKAVTPEDQAATTANILNIIDNFAAVGSKNPDHWFTPDDFKALREGLVEELATNGNTWRFWVVTGRKPAQGPE
ncbi:hypothetical protein HYFRA_00009774 [Hymenoscyphus fraxineus]|uniref:Methyltransferase n=1 Tax=Hymenoscyphus fraxineus TaxID=746836 RepID=A0A9N9PWM4_9HELO|nr:hypothetical protein HYFRA_00009774 [Hymenoscyphus fraxineus]